MIKRLLISVIFLLHFMHPGFSQDAPRLEKRGKTTQLIVDGKPFLILGGELHNSSSSDLQYLNPLWEPLILGDYSIHTRLRSNWNGVRQADKGYAIIIQLDKNEFIVAGTEVDVVFVPASSGPRMAGIASVYEGKYEDDHWIPGRLLNGDDIMMSYKLDEEAAANRTGTGARLKSEPTILKVKLYRYE